MEPCLSSQWVLKNATNSKEHADSLPSLEKPITIPTAVTDVSYLLVWEMKRQAGKRERNVYAQPSVFYPYQKCPQ